MVVATANFSESCFDYFADASLVAAAVDVAADVVVAAFDAALLVAAGVVSHSELLRELHSLLQPVQYTKNKLPSAAPH